jgi:hypothetical protein
MRRRLLLGLVVVVAMGLPAVAGAHVLRVGKYHGIKGQYTTIQPAVKAAKPGDWILIGPGDYKTRSSSMPTTGHPADSFPAAVLISTPRLKLRGMDRNKVIVDGTKSGPACNHIKADQNFGPPVKGGPGGLNGIMVWEADNVWVQNLTACNFLGGNGGAGNGIWWNGGADSGGATKVSIHGWGYLGSYLTATSTFIDGNGLSDKSEHSAAQYGIFSSNWNGGTWDHTYASNFNDSGYYIGACGQQCNQTVDHAWGQFSALGYSGSNSGGVLIVKNSEFDHNKDGFDTNSQNGDNPPPQNGACPKGKKPSVKGAVGCWVFMKNYVHDNNDVNVPFAGLAGEGPVGTGMSVSGGRNDTIINNRFANNKAWGIIFVPFPDSGGPCTGGTPNSPLLGPGSCLYDDYGDAIIHNKFTKNGGYGNPTNGDFDQLNFESHPSDCYRANTDPAGLSPDSQKLEQQHPTCTQGDVPPNPNVPFLNEVLCDSQVQLTGFGCQPGDHYPRRTKVVMHRLPPASKLTTMPNPCAGVPKNPWCPTVRHRGARDARFTG